jgi:hypothetical protein
MVEFALADGMTDPGVVEALQASVDELPAKIAGGTAAARRRR